MKFHAKKRSRAREVALQALYQYDLSGRGQAPDAHPEDLQPFIADSSEDESTRSYARRLLNGTLSSLESIDARIARAVTNWKLERIAKVDRSVLRLALYEMLEEPDVPPKVAINEAIELAKKYSTEQSGAFVNGVLDRIHHDLLKEAAKVNEETPASDVPQGESPC